MPEDNKERDEKEYLALLAIFERFVGTHADEDGRLEVIEELMAMRASHLIGHAFDGFSITLEEALELLRNTDGLSELDAARRDIVVAAVENLIDFAVAEEYQMLSELPDIDEDEEEHEGLEDDVLAIFDRYNKRYAYVENKDAEYAMIIAAGLAAVKPTTILTYMTQGDERVRPWHLQYEGVSAPKSSFPAWLVPPIEHMCRCYLVEDTVSDSVQAAAKKKLEMPDWFNPTFKESVAFGGRIFSDEHPYFQIQSEHNGTLQAISQRIKDKYYNAGN
nr:MAG TPA: minor capsid component [Caudoviricetes sp.]